MDHMFWRLLIAMSVTDFGDKNMLMTDSIFFRLFMIFGVICREIPDINETIFKNSHQSDS